MINLDPNTVSKQNYPLAWLVGIWQGTGQIGGHFEINQSHFEINSIWENEENSLKYTSEIKLSHFDENAEYKISDDVFLSEKGTFCVLNERPENLTDMSQFPIKADIKTSWLLNGALQDVWMTQYLGIAGNGRIELLSDKIDILFPEFNIANNLWRSKRMFGYVSGRVLTTWDIAQIGADSKEQDLQSLLSAGLAKNEN